jgi:hypothetical protein
LPTTITVWHLMILLVVLIMERSGIPTIQLSLLWD